MMSLNDDLYFDWSEDYSLEHHGVKGQKWGVRKRRPTGNGRRSAHPKEASKMRSVIGQGLNSLKSKASTGAKLLAAFGAKKVSDFSERRASNSEAKKAIKQAKKEAKLERQQNLKMNKKKRGRNLKGMSDEDLNNAIDRARKEQQYKELTSTRGERFGKFVKGSLADAAKSYVTGMVNQSISNAIKNSAEKKSFMESLDAEKKAERGEFNKLTTQQIKDALNRRQAKKDYQKATAPKVTLGDLAKKASKAGTWDSISNDELDSAIQRTMKMIDVRDALEGKEMRYHPYGNKKKNQNKS